MSIVSHVHHSQNKKSHHLANNIHAVDFLALAFAKTPIRICFHLDAENGLCAYLYTEPDHGWLGKFTR